MNKKDKILVLGYFGFVTNQLDGQTVKTRNIYDLLKSNLGDQVLFYDTQTLKRSVYEIFILFRFILISKRIVYIAARKNLTYVFPVLFLICSISFKKISYFVVGGWLPNFIKKHAFHRLILKKISNVLVESKAMKNILTDTFRFNNISIFPNFRIFNHIAKPEISYGPLKIVFMSRIMKKKGIELIFRYANKTKKEVLIDFYGPIDPKDKEYFDNAIRECKVAEYKGYLEPEIVHRTLSMYDVLLLPTKFYTEGLPGAVVDAYISGVPVIVTDWIHATEFVINNETGIIIPFNNGYDQFAEALNKLESDRDFLYSMKENAAAYSYNFSAAGAWRILETVL